MLRMIWEKMDSTTLGAIQNCPATPKISSENPPQSYLVSNT